MTIWYMKIVASERNIPMRVNGAAGKARQDAYQFMDEIGVKAKYHFAYRWDDEPDEALSTRLDGLLGGIQSGDTVIQLYPPFTHSAKHLDMFFQKVRAFGGKMVGYIHDLELFRNTIDDVEKGHAHMEFQYQVEKNALSRYDALIAPTTVMAQKIRHDFDYNKPIIISGPHGYITPMIPETRKKSNEVVFAGSFEKASYLEEMIANSPETTFNLYGGASGEYGQKEFSINDLPNLNLKGKFDPDALLMMLEGSYGLVWDSTSYPYVTGGKGMYEKMNTPHKVSMYIAAGLPLIVWSQMSLAKYVLENNIGWVIDDLSQLQTLIQTISEDDYNSKTKSLESVSNLIRNGVQFKRAVLESASAVNENAEYLHHDAENAPVPELGIDRWFIDANNKDKNYIQNQELDKTIVEHYQGNFHDDANYQQSREILINLGLIK